MSTINSTTELKKLCNELSKEQFVAVDLEFIREKTYYPLLCLIQVASINTAAIIDPLASGISLEPFFDLMKNPKVTKVFHSCRQDVEIIVELAGFVPAPLFDTQVAAMVCGFGESIGYEKLVGTILGISLDKTDRLSNWQLRPLDDGQLQYALGDVTHLVKIYQHLLAEMQNKGRLNWIDEEMDILTRKDTYYTDPDNAWLKIRHRTHSNKVLSNLKALAAWREKRAMDKNVPKQSIIKDEMLIMIATSAPKTIDSLMQIRGMKKDVASGTLGQEMLDALKNAKYDSKLAKEIEHDTYNAIPALVELLKTLVKIISHQEGVVARLIAGETEILKLAGHYDTNNPVLSGWRYQIFGKQALELRNGQTSISYNPTTKQIEFSTYDA